MALKTADTLQAAQYPGNNVAAGNEDHTQEVAPRIPDMRYMSISRVVAITAELHIIMEIVSSLPCAEGYISAKSLVALCQWDRDGGRRHIDGNLHGPKSCDRISASPVISCIKSIHGRRVCIYIPVPVPISSTFCIQTTNSQPKRPNGCMSEE